MSDTITVEEPEIVKSDIKDGFVSGFKTDTSNQVVEKKITESIPDSKYTKFDVQSFLKKAEFYNKINTARKHAIEVITNNAITKMLRSVKNGFNRTILYKYQWSPEPDAMYDPAGNRIIFGDGIRLSDLIRKGGKQFFRDLDDFFNKNGDQKYFTGIYPKKYDDVTIWNIYVSWNDEQNYVK
jgi:hypothetical protein